MIQARRSAALLLLIAWAAPWPASAQPGPAASAPPGVVAAIPGNAPARAVLVGPSGELYLPSHAPDTPDTGVTWRRHAAGGVAVDVRAAMSPKPGEYIVAGAHSPLYRSVDDIWRALPLSQRGPVLLSADGGAIALAVGPQLHIFKKGGTFQRVARARGRPAALWASSSDRLYVARQGGGLDKWQNKRWSVIRHPLAADDEILALAGQPGRALYALAQSGAVLAVGANQADVIHRPPELEAFAPHAMAVAADVTLWLAGTAAPADAAAPSQALILASRTAKAESLAPATSSTPPELATGDRVTVLIAGADGALLVATRAGRVLLRDPTGQWREGRIETAMPAPKSTSRAAGPAHTR